MARHDGGSGEERRIGGPPRSRGPPRGIPLTAGEATPPRACVRFVPAGRAVEVPRGTYLTAAAVRAAVTIVHDCDGQGVCGTCRVRVARGDENLSPIDLHERAQLGDEVEGGWRLCCRARVLGDVLVRVPGRGFAYPPELQRG